MKKIINLFIILVLVLITCKSDMYEKVDISPRTRYFTLYVNNPAPLLLHFKTVEGTVRIHYEGIEKGYMIFDVNNEIIKTRLKTCFVFKQDNYIYYFHMTYADNNKINFRLVKILREKR